MQKKSKLLLLVLLLAICTGGYLFLRSVEWEEAAEEGSSFNVQSISEVIEAEESTEEGSILEEENSEEESTLEEESKSEEAMTEEF